MRPQSREVLTERIIRERLRRTGAFVQRLRQTRPDLDELRAVAIAQHYSSPAQLHTWLVDVTSNPFAALYFASSGAENGDIGIVESICVQDWN